MTTHNRFIPLALVATALMASSGCVCVSTPRASGDVTFFWSFGGQPCAVVPDITSVTIQVAGQVLQNGGTYACVNAGTAGIVLLDFRPGTYSFSIQGNNAQGTSLYEGSGKFTVNGDVTVNVNLVPSANAPGKALITWSFPQNATCAAAIPGSGEAIRWVDIVVDSSAPSRQECTAGIAGTIGLEISSLLAGNHTVELRAFGQSGFQYLGVINTIAVMAGGTVAGEFQLQYVTGSLPLKWQFASGSIGLTCEQIASPDVFINFKDSTGNFVYPDNGGSGRAVPCRNADRIQGTYFPYLHGGTYEVYVQAVGPGNTLYRSNQSSPPIATVTAGVFAPLNEQSPTVNVTNP